MFFLLFHVRVVDRSSLWLWLFGIHWVIITFIIALADRQTDRERDVDVTTTSPPMPERERMWM